MRPVVVVKRGHARRRERRAHHQHLNSRADNESVTLIIFGKSRARRRVIALFNINIPQHVARLWAWRPWRKSYLRRRLKATLSYVPRVKAVTAGNKGAARRAVMAGTANSYAAQLSAWVQAVYHLGHRNRVLIISARCPQPTGAQFASLVIIDAGEH